MKPVQTPPSIRKDITGHVYGHITILGFSRFGSRSGETFWVAKCDCGSVWEITRANLSCVRQCRKCAYKITRRFRPPWYKRLAGYYVTIKQYKDRLCERWQTLDGFIDDIGEPPDGYIHVPMDGEINKDTIRWEQKIQHRNGRYVQVNGELLNLSEIAVKASVTREAIRLRVNKGLDGNDLLESRESSWNKNLKRIGEKR